MAVLGIIPAAGTGSRLGMPFHKALAPTITDRGIVPLYRHAYDRLARVCDDVAFVLSEPLDLPGHSIFKSFRGELPSSLALAAKTVSPDTLCAVALPDAIWWPRDGMDTLVARYQQADGPLDGVLGLFEGSSHVLDRVETSMGFVSAIHRHTDPPAAEIQVQGWGCLVATAGCLAGLTDDRPLGPQLSEYRFLAVHLTGPYHDLGTPERYVEFHDLRHR